MSGGIRGGIQYYSPPGRPPQGGPHRNVWGKQDWIETRLHGKDAIYVDDTVQ